MTDLNDVLKHQLFFEFWHYLSRIPFSANIYISSQSDLTDLKLKLEQNGHSVSFLPFVDFGMDIGDFIFQLKSMELNGNPWKSVESLLPSFGCCRGANDASLIQAMFVGFRFDLFFLGFRFRFDYSF